MTMLAERSTDDVLAIVLADRPDVLAALRACWDAAWAAVDPVLLELCRLEVADILGCAPEWHSRTPAAQAAGFDEAMAADVRNWHASTRFDDRQRACLAFTEQFVIDVANLDDATATGVRTHLGDVGLLDFARALLVVEQRQRLRLVWAELLEVGA